MRLDFPLTETSVSDPNDPDRHAAFWMDHRGECLQRGRIQPIEYAATEATIGGARHPFRFHTDLDGLCVFQRPPQTAIIATDVPGTPLRTGARAHSEGVSATAVQWLLATARVRAHRRRELNLAPLFERAGPKLPPHAD